MFQEILISFFLFAALYFEVFMLLTLIERSKELKASPLADTSNPGKLPSVTIVVPCFNEQETVAKTVASILALDYPKEKLFVSVVDDGSRDHTWQYVQRWKGHPQVALFHKENGGKYTALNYGIRHANTDLVGCLDADSFVEPDALRKIVYRFQNDPEIMAVAPAVKIWKPDSLIRSIQYVEYIYGIFIKKLFSLMNAVHVTPGPFSIFRRSVFDEIGYFRHAHNTEDMEIALRLQTHHKKIDNCHDALVYTVGPKTLRSLHKQRVRWTYGFIKNSFDYRSIFFSRKVGNVGFFTLPMSIISLTGALVSAFYLVYHFGTSMYLRVERYYSIGWKFVWPKLTFDWFFISTGMIFFLAIIASLIGVGMILGSFKLSKQKIRIHELAIYLVIYPFVAISWIARSVFNVVFIKKTTWR